MDGSESGAEQQFSSPPTDLPEPTGEVIYIEFVPTPTKDSTPPPLNPAKP